MGEAAGRRSGGTGDAVRGWPAGVHQVLGEAEQAAVRQAALDHRPCYAGLSGQLWRARDSAHFSRPPPACALSDYLILMITFPNGPAVA